MWILLAVIITATGIFTVPSIISSFRNIMHETLQNGNTDSEQTAHEDLDHGESAAVRKPLCRYSREDEAFHIESAELDEAERRQVSRPSADRIDSSLLALTLGPDPEELSMGYFSAFPAGTEYIGSRLIRNALYIAFSEQLGTDHPLGEFGIELAAMQTAQALADFPSVQQIIILSGEETVFGPFPLSESSTRVIPPSAAVQ